MGRLLEPRSDHPATVLFEEVDATEIAVLGPGAPRRQRELGACAVANIDKRLVAFDLHIMDIDLQIKLGDLVDILAKISVLSSSKPKSSRLSIVPISSK